jgi:hypothetical protein
MTEFELPEFVPDPLLAFALAYEAAAIAALRAMFFGVETEIGPFASADR